MKISMGLLLITVALSLGGCDTVSSLQRGPGDYRPPQPASARPSDTGSSLFAEDASVMDDAAIAHALDARVAVPARIRLAVLQLPDAGSLAYRYDMEYTGVSGDLFPDFIAALRSSPRLYDASYLPDMLLPDKQTLPYLRAAAARFQADLLMVVRPRCDIVTNFKLFAPNEVHAYCKVEVVLVDTRSGVVPFTSVATEEMVATRTDADPDFSVTVGKAREAAIAKDLAKIAQDTLGFLKTLPVS